MLYIKVTLINNFNVNIYKLYKIKITMETGNENKASKSKDIHVQHKRCIQQSAKKWLLNTDEN